MSVRRPSSKVNVSADPPPSVASEPAASRRSSSWLVVLAASGAAIGFNNLWQFPALAAEHGGGAFVLVYLLFALAFGAPLLMAELILGRRARGSALLAYRLPHAGRPPTGAWWLTGWVSVGACFLVFSYLAVIAGWTLAYLVRAALGLFTGQTADGMASLFTALVRDPEKQLFWHALFVGAVMLLAWRGARAVLDLSARIIVPLLAALLLVVLMYALSQETLPDAIAHVLLPDFSKLTLTAVSAAAGQVFFSLGLGFGMMLMYGAHLKDSASVPRAAYAIAGIDLVTAVVGAVAVYALLFAGGVEPASGPGLAFQALPLALDHLPWGRALTILFFALLTTVALLRAMALFETIVVAFGQRWSLPRKRLVAIVGLAAWGLGLVTILSFNYWAFSFEFFGSEKKLGAFDALQIATTHALLPAAALALAVYCGWFVPRFTSQSALGIRSRLVFAAWLWSLRLLVPLLLLVLLAFLPKLYA